MLDRRIVARLRGGRPPYVIKNKDGDGGPATIRIYEEIGVWGVTEEEFAQELAGVTADEIEVQISSPGGDVFSGIAIYNALRAHPARVTTRVDSLAASIASVIVQAGDHRVMLKHSQQMIHTAWGLVIGTADDMRQMAELLDRQTDVIAGIYADRGGRAKTAMRKLMDAETWFTDREAVDAGLADEIVDPANSKARHRHGGGNELTADQRRVIRAAEWQLWKAELDRFARTHLLDIERDRFNRSLASTADPVGYVEIPFTAVPAGIVDIAAITVTAAAADLRVAVPEVRWVRRSGPGETPDLEHSPFNGLADRGAGVIWLDSTLSAKQVVSIAAHEVAHLAGRDEIDASNYGDKYRI